MGVGVVLGVAQTHARPARTARVPRPDPYVPCPAFAHARTPQKKEIASAKVATQKAVDAAIAGKLDATMKGYLGSRFSLKSGQYPHEMQF